MDVSPGAARDGLMPSFHRAAPPGSCTAVGGQKCGYRPLGPGRHHGLVGDDDDGVIGQIREIVLDSPDPWALAAFWAGLLGGTPVQWYPGWVTLEPPPHGQRLSFQGSTAGDDPAGSTPAATGVHFDVLVGDLTAAHDRVVASGGTFTAEHISPRPGPAAEAVRWRVYRDPAGHPFCLVTR
jgi:hypothetical protein